MAAVTLQPWTNGQTFQIVLTFDNNSTYTATQNSGDDKMLESIEIQENSALTDGNPVGIMTPNYASFRIFDRTGALLTTNTGSSYYGYMRNGVKVNIYMSEDLGITWVAFGEYYTESWYSEKSEGGFALVNLSCTDKLSYIGQKEMPALPAYAGVDVTVLLAGILQGIGLSISDFIIDPSLQLSMLYAVAKGDRVREALNTIAQSLLARIYVNRAGVIEVRPAIPTKTIAYVMDDSTIETVTVKHNKIAQYNKIKLLYNKVDDRPSETLLMLNNANIKTGVNALTGLTLSKSVLGIDAVHISTAATAESNLEKITSIDYLAYQGGIDITIVSALVDDFLANIEVTGRCTGVTDAYVESTIAGTDAKVANTLTLESYVIQEDAAARTYVASVASYLRSMRQEVEITGTLSQLLTVQQYITITSDDANIAGDYLITGFNLSDGAAYSTTVTAVRVV